MDLFSPLALGGLELPNRLVMAPLTPTRSRVDGVPNDDVVEYYRQRASMGLIVSEDDYPSATSQGLVRQPGLVTEDRSPDGNASPTRCTPRAASSSPR